MTTAAATGAARALRAAGAALPVALGVAAAAGSVAVLLRPAAWTPVAVVAALALATLAWVRPVLAAAVLLAIAPICGTKPVTGPYLFFVAFVACAVPGWLARLATRDRALALDTLTTPTGLALLGYVGASCLSLSSLPIYAPADIVGADTIGDAIRALPAALAGADVTDTIYPVLTVILTLHALVAALVVAVAIRRDALIGPGDPAGRSADHIAAAAVVTGGILAGLVITVAAGALDRLGLVDLRLLRITDPFTNVTGADRLQSTFGHAGWLAEYVCFATPAILGLWLWPGPAGGAEPALRRRARVAAAMGLLLAALVVIVLSYQRGGWITWAIIGAGVAAAIVRLATASADTTAAPPLRRLLAIAAGAALLAIAAGLVVVRVAGGPGAMDRFAARARTITQVSDRQAHVTAGLRLGALMPVLGSGSESFALRYRDEYLRAGGEYYARGASPLLEMYGSAHNVFAQTFAGKGTVGLVALLVVVLVGGAAALRTLRQARSADARVVAAVALGMIAAFAIYGQVQEVFYIPPLQLMVFTAFGLAAALDRPAAVARAASPATARLGIVTALLGLALAVHLVYGYVLPGTLAEGYRDREISRAGARLSAPVLGDDGQYFQWTGHRAVVTVPRQARELSFDLRRPGATPREVEVRFDGRAIDRVRLEDGDWRHVVYPLRRVRALPRRLEIVVLPGPAGAAEEQTGVAIRRIWWGME